jgi:hypothetical protein
LNSILILKELWERRLLVTLAVLAAAAISIVAVFQVSLSPPSIAKRDHVNSQGSIEILVDSARSPIADAQRDLTGLTARAGVFARLMVGGDVIARIAKASHIPLEQIDTVGPVPIPGQVPGAEESAQLRPYGIEVIQDGELPILSVVTRAPTAAEARALAVSAPEAISEVVRTIQDQQGTPVGKRVEFRVLGPPESTPVEEAQGKKTALIVFLILLALFVVLILGIPRLIEAWRHTDPEPAHWNEEPPSQPDVLHLHADRAADAEADGLEAAQVAQHEPNRGQQWVSREP